MVGVASHQLEGATQRRLRKEPHAECAPGDNALESLGPPAGRAQEVKDLREHGCRCYDRLADGPHDLAASLMGRVLGIEQGNEGTGVNQYHRPIFRRMISRIPRLTSLAGARAYPPGPRSRVR